mmetsp:Transcript_16117/g.21381  ORF Transcript_16117/g.21381 Transcript_16117/m.21381 type:complete len:93 (-) Transcript_16117:38-316(-)
MSSKRNFEWLETKKAFIFNFLYDNNQRLHAAENSFLPRFSFHMSKMPVYFKILCLNLFISSCQEALARQKVKRPRNRLKNHESWIIKSRRRK